MSVIQWEDLFPVPEGQPRPQTEMALVSLPTQGRAEREHLYLWVVGEEGYVSGKFDDQRNGHDDSMRKHHLSQDGEGFWFRQIVQYYDRARLSFNAAEELRDFANQIDSMTDSESHAKAKRLRRDARFQEMKAQQALCKAFMTAKGAVESSIRVYGPLPKPGLSSGNVEEWVE